MRLGRSDGQVTVLTDGTTVRLRPLGRGERDLVADFFAGLSAQSRRRRFLQEMPRLPEPMLRYLVDVDGHRHVALVAQVDGQTAGIARFVALPDQPDAAEVAVTVADRYQGRGIGGLLVDALRPLADQAGVGSFVYLVDPINRPMLRLLRRRGVALRLRGGLVEGHQSLAGLGQLMVAAFVWSSNASSGWRTRSRPGGRTG
jgi:GNAT superfamily N-acetyltransferase